MRSLNKKNRLDNKKIGYSNEVNLNDAYFSDIGKIESLTKEEEKTLMKNIQEARQEFFSCLLSHNGTLKYIVDTYKKNNVSLLKLLPYFSTARTSVHKVSRSEIKDFFHKNIEKVESLLKENKEDFFQIKNLKKGNEQQKRNLKRRTNMRTKKAINLIEELGYNYEKLFTGEESLYKILFMAGCRYDKLESKEENSKLEPLVKDFLDYSSNKHELKNYIDKLTVQHDNYLKLRNEMVESNLKLVISYAKKMYNRWLSYPDAIQAGNIGLMRAIDKYNLDYGYSFSTYASYWIKRAILSSSIPPQRGSYYLNQNIRAVMLKYYKLREELGRNPTIEEMVDKYKIKKTTVERALRLYSLKLISLDVPVSDDDHDGDDLFFDPVDNSNSYDEEKIALERSAIIKEAINELIEKNKNDDEQIKRNCEMLLMRYGLNKGDFLDASQGTQNLLKDENSSSYKRFEIPYDDISKHFDLTQQRVRQVIYSLYRKLKPILIKKSTLADYLDCVVEKMEELDNKIS